MENRCQRRIVSFMNLIWPQNRYFAIFQSNLSAEVTGIVGDFVTLKQSVASNYERFGSRVEEIGAKILDGSGRFVWSKLVE